ncbi:MAG: nucleotidyltransferase family protein [Cyanobacteria bacterium J06581_3]
MEPLNTIKDKLIQIKPYLQYEHHVTELGIFGSYVRGEQTSASDVDILVEFDPSYKLGLITYGQIESYISDHVGIPVDLVMKRALKPYIGKRILEEVIYLWSNETSETISTTS